MSIAPAEALDLPREEVRASRVATPAAGWKAGWPGTLALAAGAVAVFHGAWMHSPLGFLMAGWAGLMTALAGRGSPRSGFYLGLMVGVAIYGPHLTFFVGLFGAGGVVLWMVLGVFVGLWLMTARGLRERMSVSWWIVSGAVLWTGWEYFRSEVWPLKFTWLSLGYAAWERPGCLIHTRAGVYGLGFLLFLCGAGLAARWRSGGKRTAVAALFLLGLIWNTVGRGPVLRPGTSGGAEPARLAGVQWEVPTEGETLQALQSLARAEPDATVLVLSEYTFTGPVPQTVKDWCRENGKTLVVGGQDPVDGGGFFNTAFVIGTSGEVVFGQAKSVPIQFFADGFPAREQALWHSGWGAVGLLICYDLSYRRVVDRLVDLGAEVLIVPTMDSVDWGAAEHRLHGRVAPVRAAELGLPIFRLASSGYSQAVDGRGKILAEAGFPGQGEVLAAALRPAGAGRRPWDRWWGPLCCVAAWVGLGIVLLPRRWRFPGRDH